MTRAERSAGIRILGAAATAALLLVACGGDGETAREGESSTTQAVGDEAPTQSENGRRPLVCADPPPTEVGIGGATESSIDLEALFRCFWVDVPEGLDRVTFELSGLSADLEMLLGYGFLVRIQYPGLGEFWTAPVDGAGDEVIVVEDPSPGPYFVYVRADEPNAVTPFTLATAVTPATNAAPTGAALPDPNRCAAPATTIELGSSVTGELIGRDEPPLSHEYFCVQVPDGVGSITVQLSDLDDAIELIARYADTGQLFSDRRRSGPERVVVIDTQEPGAYFIDVAAALPGAASPFTLTVTES